MEQNHINAALELIDSGPNYDQFKKNPTEEAKKKIPNMSDRAHAELQQVFLLMDRVRDCLARRDLIQLEDLARNMFFVCQSLITDKIDLSDKIDKLVKTMFDEITKAHLNHAKRNSLHAPSYRY